MITLITDAQHGNILSLAFTLELALFALKFSMTNNTLLFEQYIVWQYLRKN